MDELSPWQIFNLHRWALRHPPEYRFVACPYGLPECRCHGFTRSDLEFLASIGVGTKSETCKTDESFLKACGISSE